jgi:hypothetical protein
MKKITIIYLALILALPVLLHAQYGGGSGRGDVMVSLTSIPLSVHKITMEIPTKYDLTQNYPNPFNPTTKIKFDVARVGDVKIVVYDVMGREVQTLVNESLKPGTYETSFDASALNSGVYFYRMVAGDYKETKKLLLLK